MMQLQKGDITAFGGDAIVNAANNSLLGGGGVDGAIHKAAGPQLLAECKTLGGCETGQAKITKGYNLPARFVIHTVGPVWYGGEKGEHELLERAYRNSLELALSTDLATIAFPNISTGIYAFPKPQAAQIAISVVKEMFVKAHDLQVTFICFDDENYQLYQKLLA